MKRICVLGDSHVAALKNGLAGVQPAFPDFQFTFFAAGGDNMGNIAVENGRLVPTSDYVKQVWEVTAGGLTHIDSDFDHYILCGLGIRITKAAVAYRKLFTELRPANREMPDDEVIPAKTFCDLASTSLCAHTFQRLREISNRQAVLIGNPYPAEDRAPKVTEWISRKKQHRQISEFYNRGCARFAESWGAQFSPQPPETIGDNSLLTKEAFSLAPKHLLGHPVEDDRGHMNADYGAIVLRAALCLIA